MIFLNKFVLTLSELAKSDQPLSLVGGKAANLGILVKHGFQVPDGLVITTQAYNRFIDQNNLGTLINKELGLIDFTEMRSIEAAASIIQKAIKESSLPQELIHLIDTNYLLSNLLQVAIRSSATAEDLPTASFAGQQESYLNVRGKNEILHSLKECYASLWSSRTIAYRNQHNIPQKNVKLAVIIQSMISASSAGVIFTESPVSLNKNEILIEATFGLGESLVSGQLFPDQFIITRSESSLENDLQIISREISHKEFKIESAKVGITKVPLSPNDQDKQSITDDQVLQLASMSIKIERTFKSPQDIEWVYDKENKLYITQSRPITTIQTPDKGIHEVFWTRGYADDYWNDTTTPLFYDLLGIPLTLIVNTELNSIMGYPKISDQLLYLHHGHVYFNLETLLRKVEYEIPPFIRTDDVLNYFPEGEGPFCKKTVRKMPFRLGKRIISELRIMLHDNIHGSILKTAETYQRWTKEEFWPFCEKFDSLLSESAEMNQINSIIQLSDSLEHQMAEHFRMVRYGIPVHNIGMNLLSNYLLTRFIGKRLSTALYPILISGLWHKTAETNEEVQNLAAKIHGNSNLKDLILETESSELYDILENKKEDKDISKFLEELKNFLGTFGDRGFSREIYFPRWRDDPSYLFDQLKALVIDQKVDMAELKKQNLKRRKNVENYVAFRIRSTRFGLLKFKLFATILNLARKYISFRENQRFNLDKWIARNRQLYLEIGNFFVSKRYLRDSEDIFFLYKHEVRNLLRAPKQFSIPKTLNLIKNRKNDFNKYEYAIPPKFLHGSREFDDPIPKSYDNSNFRGIPASNGIITAKTRILTDIKQVFTVRAGEILVVPKTDPGWTPVFAKIGGLITETGGILSHGAVVSREYGIPSVTNIINACKILKTGMIVKVNGTEGIVSILNE